MSVFHFKKFDVQNSLSAMKVNTDGVLLGVTAPLEISDRHILDIGTGTGVIALILAQRLAELRDSTWHIDKADQEPDNTDAIPDTPAKHTSPTEIIGIDIDPEAASEAALNFKNSPWRAGLKAINVSLSEYSHIIEQSGSQERSNFQEQSYIQRQSYPSPEQSRFDLIVSNPPYYDDSLINPDSRKATARHTGDGLSFRELMDFSSKHLAEDGRLAIVLPADQETALLRYGRMCGLYAHKILRIKTVERKQPIRIIVSFRKSKCDVIEDRTLTLIEKGKYTEQYISLTKSFYLFA